MATPEGGAHPTGTRTLVDLLAWPRLRTALLWSSTNAHWRRRRRGMVAWPHHVAGWG